MKRQDTAAHYNTCPAVCEPTAPAQPTRSIHLLQPQSPGAHAALPGTCWRVRVMSRKKRSGRGDTTEQMMGSPPGPQLLAGWLPSTGWHDTVLIEVYIIAHITCISQKAFHSNKYFYQRKFQTKLVNLSTTWQREPLDETCK